MHELQPPSAKQIARALDAAMAPIAAGAESAIAAFGGLSRRNVLIGGMVAAGQSLPLRAARPLFSSLRCRVIVDNDFSGDPDGLFQLAHQLASPSAVVDLLLASHLRPGARADRSARQAENGVRRAIELMDTMRLPHRPPVIAGRNAAPLPGTPPEATPAVRAIVASAMRDDPLPLYYVAGAGLTDLAEAVRMAPQIAPRLRLVWIGGPDASEVATSRPAPLEYNLAIDVAAARTLFNDSSVEIWQVPRTTYRSMILSHAELLDGLRGSGRLGRYLLDHVDRAVRETYPDMGETYLMGDSPLVTLTTLQSSFDPDTTSSPYRVCPTPHIAEDGRFEPVDGTRPMRVYTGVDTRLTFADMFAKLRAASR